MVSLKRLFEKAVGVSVYNSVQITCPTLRLGTERGGYAVCPQDIRQDSIVYSFGIGNDISFDSALIEKFGVKVYAFDPTPKSISWIRSRQIPEGFHFFEFGIAPYDGFAQFNPPRDPGHVSYTTLKRKSKTLGPVQAKVHRLRTIMDMLGHQSVDILKMDIEGAEYEVIDDLIASGIRPRQILIEFHHRFKNVGVKRTNRTIAALNRSGYRIFHVSPKGHEYSFISSDTCPSNIGSDSVYDSC
jgi:FkbM family methyltransferase